jgi:hypothetical protein
MNADMAKDVQKVIEGLSPEQKKALAELFDEAGEKLPVEKVKRHGLEKQGVETCIVVMKCRLCSTEHKTPMQSSSHLPSTMEISTCISCETVLMGKSREELVVLAIKAADGAWDLVKKAKNADVVCPIDIIERKEPLE